MLVTLFAKPHEEQSIIFNEMFIEKVWEVIKLFLTNLNIIFGWEDKALENTKEELWELIKMFLRVNFKGKNDVLNWFYTQCLHSEDY